MKTERRNSSTRAREFNIPFSIMDRPPRQKMNKETEDLHNTLNQLGLTGSYRTLYSTIAEYIFISCAHGTFSKTDHMLGHKTNLNFKRLKAYKVRSLTTTK